MNAHGIDSHDRGPLIKVAGIFGSDHADERASAAPKPHEVLQRCGLTWEDIATPRPQVRLRSDDRSIARRCAQHRSHMSEWKGRFIDNIIQQPRVSKNQFAVLHEIKQKIEEAL